MLLAIDIGTSNSSAAIVENGAPTAIKIGAEDYAVPSAVFVDESGKLLISSAAISKRASSPTRFKDNFKRDFGMDKSYELGGVTVTPEEIYEAYYRFFKEGYEQTGAVIDGVVATHPANFSEKRKGLMRDILAGVFQMNNNKIRLLEEPKAALYTFPKEQMNTGDVLLVYDFGGGTLDLAIARMTAEGLTVEGYEGTDLGGADFDGLIRHDIIEKLGITAESLKKERLQKVLLDMAVKAKHQLSVTEDFTLTISMDYDDYSITRADFNAMLEPLMTRSDELIERLLTNTGYEKDEITRVMCVGGSSCIPFVPVSVEKALGKRPLTSTKPDLAVCLGAALVKEDGKPEAPEQKVEEKITEKAEVQPPEVIAEDFAETQRSKTASPDTTDEQKPDYSQWDNCKFYIENNTLLMDGNGFEKKQLVAETLSLGTLGIVRGEGFCNMWPIHHKGYVYFTRLISSPRHCAVYRFDLSENKEEKVYESLSFNGFAKYHDDLYFIGGYPVRISKISQTDSNNEIETIFKLDRKKAIGLSNKNHLLTFAAYDLEVSDYSKQLNPFQLWLYRRNHSSDYDVKYTNTVRYEFNLETGEARQLP